MSVCHIQFLWLSMCWYGIITISGWSVPCWSKDSGITSGDTEIRNMKKGSTKQDGKRMNMRSQCLQTNYMHAHACRLTYIQQDYDASSSNYRCLHKLMKRNSRGAMERQAADGIWTTCVNVQTILFLHRERGCSEIRLQHGSCEMLTLLIRFKQWP